MSLALPRALMTSRISLNTATSAATDRSLTRSLMLRPSHSSSSSDSDSHSAALLPHSQSAHYSSASTSSTSPYSLLESRFHHYISPSALTELRYLLTPYPVITLGGDQLTGKSTLAKRLNALLNPKSALIAFESSYISHHHHPPPKFDTLYSAGSIFRSTAKELGISVPELSRRSLTNPQIDIKIEYSLLKLICHGIPWMKNMNIGSNGSVVNHSHSPVNVSHSPVHSSHLVPFPGFTPFYTIIEGRQPAVMATYAQHCLAKKNCLRIYLRCSVKEQAIRFIEREVPEIHSNDTIRHQLMDYLDAQEQLKPFQDLGQVSTLLEQWIELEHLQVALQGFPMDKLKRICQEFRDNDGRDHADRKRFFTLYGTSPALDYRNLELYDLVIDTTPNTSEQTFSQAVEGLKKFGIRIPEHKSQDGIASKL